MGKLYRWTIFNKAFHSTCNFEIHSTYFVSKAWLWPFWLWPVAVLLSKRKGCVTHNYFIMHYLFFLEEVLIKNCFYTSSLFLMGNFMTLIAFLRELFCFVLDIKYYMYEHWTARAPHYVWADRHLHFVKVQSRTTEKFLSVHKKSRLIKKCWPVGGSNLWPSRY